MTNFILSPEFLDLSLYFLSYSPLGKLDYGTELNPFDYLGFARADLEDKSGNRSVINSVGNAKRALHLQVDTICEGYGFTVIQKSNNFPEKLEFLHNLGLVTPRILKKLNTIRNKVEHDYSVPNEEDADLFCDVIELFLYATEGPINNFPDKVEFSSEDCDQLDVEKFEAMYNFPPPLEISINVKPNKGELFVYDSSVWNQDKFIAKVNIKDGDEYYSWLKMIFKHTFRRF